MSPTFDAQAAFGQVTQGLDARQDKMYKELKDRIGRLQDFMNDQLRKAS